jgi:AcrR family transcriptional regulator
MSAKEPEDSAGPATTRRAEIIEAAIPVFLRFGYKKTSMDAVADAAGLSRQAVYLHFPGKEALFGAVVEQLCESTRRAAHTALWRPDLALEEQLLAAFADILPRESMPLLAELLVTARALVPDSVVNIDKLVVGEIAARLRSALGQRNWPVPAVDENQAAQVLQAASYGLKEQTGNRDEYLAGMRSAISIVLTAGGLASSGSPTRQGSRDRQ